MVVCLNLQRSLQNWYFERFLLKMKMPYTSYAITIIKVQFSFSWGYSIPFILQFEFHFKNRLFKVKYQSKKYVIKTFFCTSKTFHYFYLYFFVNTIGYPLFGCQSSSFAVVFSNTSWKHVKCWKENVSKLTGRGCWDG